MKITKIKQIWMIGILLILLSSFVSATTWYEEYSDNFSTDEWTDVGGSDRVYVDTGNERINAQLDRTATSDDYTYINVSEYLPDKENFNITIKVYHGSDTSGTYGMVFSLTDTAGDFNSQAGLNSFGMYDYSDITNIRLWDRLNNDFIAYTISGSTWYELEMSRTSAGNIELKLYNNDRSSLLVSDSYSSAGFDFSNMDYLLIASHDTSAGASQQYYLDNLTIYSNIAPNTNFTISAESFWDSSSINNFSATIIGDSYNQTFNTTSGTITTDILTNDTNNYSIYLSTTDWFNESYLNQSVNTSLTASLKQSEVSFACYEKVSQTALNCTNSTIYPDAGDYNFTISVSSYEDVVTPQTITALQNDTINVTGFYYANLSFINNFESGNATCDYTVTGIDYPSYSETTNSSSVGLINGSYSLLADCVGYAYAYENVTIENLTQNVTFDLYITNQVNINIYDEETANLITENITVTKTLGATQTQNITNTGTISFKQITSGNYTFSFEGDSYPKRTYTVTVGERSYQTLNAYLLANSTNDLVLAFRNSDNQNEYLEGVTVSVSKIINSTNTLLTVLTSDITGRVQFNYEIGAKYCFDAQLTNYENKEWCFDPVIFSEYNILMIPTATINYDNAYSQVIAELETLSYWNNKNNTVQILFANPNGDFTNYGFNATWSATTITESGTNAYGEQISNIIEIAGASYGDQITINYYYQLVDGTQKDFTKTFYVIGSDSQYPSFEDNKDETHGMGILERTLMVVLIVLLVVGAGTYFSGSIEAGGLVGLFVLGYFTYIGFMDKWAGLITMMMMFVLLAWGSKR